MKPVNTFALLRDYFNLSFEKPLELKPLHCTVLMYALDLNNRLGWKEEFTLPTSHSMEAINIRNYKSYINALLDLESFGFIKIVSRAKNQHTGNVIAFNNLYKAEYKALPKALDKATINEYGRFTQFDQSNVQSNDQSTTQSNVQSNVSIDKQINNKTNKQKNNTLKKSYHKYFETVDYEKDFVLDKTEPEEVRFSKWYFNLLPVEKRKLYKFNKNTLGDWCDTYDKLIRLDGYTKEEIKAVCEFARNDSFWSNNFYSPTKLRVFKKEHGVKVIVQLIEAMNKKETKTEAYSMHDKDGYVKIKGLN